MVGLLQASGRGALGVAPATLNKPHCILPTEVVPVATHHVVLTEHQDEFVESLVRGGRFQNAGEVLRAGLRLLEQQQHEYVTKVQALRQAAQLGWDDLEAGRYVDVADEDLDNTILNVGSRSQGPSAAS